MESSDDDLRVTKAVRIADEGQAAIQAIADRDGISWSEAARRLLAYSAQKMPEGWHPGKERR